MTVLDNLSTGRLGNLDGSWTIPDLRFVVGDILDVRRSTRRSRGADRVFHLAAAVGVHLIVDKPLESLRTNIHGTEIVLDAALDAGAPCCWPRPARSTARTPRTACPRSRTASSARRSSRAGPTPQPRASTRHSRTPTGASTAYRSRSSDCSTPSGRGRPAATAWSCRTWCARPWRANR